MTRPPTRRRSAAPTPGAGAAARLLALVCLLLVSAVGTAEAAHIHGALLPDNTLKAAAPADAGLPGGPEHCPLCVAMHSAMPVELRSTPAPSIVVERRAPAVMGYAPDAHWHFAMFSRPPPASHSL